jgi:hypothetical protein
MRRPRTCCPCICGRSITRSRRGRNSTRLATGGAFDDQWHVDPYPPWSSSRSTMCLRLRQPCGSRASGYEEGCPWGAGPSSDGIGRPVGEQEGSHGRAHATVRVSRCPAMTCITGRLPFPLSGHRPAPAAVALCGPSGPPMPSPSRVLAFTRVLWLTGLVGLVARPTLLRKGAGGRAAAERVGEDRAWIAGGGSPAAAARAGSAGARTGDGAYPFDPAIWHVLSTALTMSLRPRRDTDAERIEGVGWRDAA